MNVKKQLRIARKAIGGKLNIKLMDSLDDDLRTVRRIIRLLTVRMSALFVKAG